MESQRCGQGEGNLLGQVKLPGRSCCKLGLKEEKQGALWNPAITGRKDWPVMGTGEICPHKFHGASHWPNSMRNQGRRSPVNLVSGKIGL
jgi:hypothetical protein